MKKIPGCFFISRLPGSALRKYVKLLGKPRDATSILNAMPGKLDIKDTHLFAEPIWCKIEIMLGIFSCF